MSDWEFQDVTIKQVTEEDVILGDGSIRRLAGKAKDMWQHIKLGKARIGIRPDGMINKNILTPILLINKIVPQKSFLTYIIHQSTHFSKYNCKYFPWRETYDLYFI